MHKEQTRFDARISKSQKALFERAALLGGFRSLTEFVFSSAVEKAEQILQKHEAILQSERDREIFFDALINPQAPNEYLREAIREYKEKTM